MGLEDFKSEDKHKIGEVKTRKQIKNVKFKEKTWKRLLYHNPVMGYLVASDGDESDVKAIIQTMDEIIEEGLEGEVISEDNIKRLKTERQNIIDDILEG